MNGVKSKNGIRNRSEKINCKKSFFVIDFYHETPIIRIQGVGFGALGIPGSGGVSMKGRLVSGYPVLFEQTWGLVWWSNFNLLQVLVVLGVLTVWGVLDLPVWLTMSCLDSMVALWVTHKLVCGWPLYICFGISEKQGMEEFLKSWELTMKRLLLKSLFCCSEIWWKM